MGQKVLLGRHRSGSGQVFLTLASDDVSLCVIRAIERPVVACVVAALVALICIFLAELPRALIAPSIALDGKQTPYDYPVVAHAVIIAASVAIGIAAAIKFDAELQIDRLRPPPFWPKSAGDWLVALWLFGVFLSSLLGLLRMVLHNLFF